MTSSPQITLLTDFGTADGYVAEMKGVLATLLPGTSLLDASHEIPPGDVHAAAWALGRYWRAYPPGTVHLAVVDPGVGTERRAIVLEADGRLTVAPDNGLVTRVLEDAGSWRCHAIADPGVPPSDRSATFHGRDIFAPAAARLALGLDPAQLGPAVADPVRLVLPQAFREGPAVNGEVIRVDRFGNLVTDIPGDAVPGGGRVKIAGRELPLLRTYADVASGSLLALVNSAGWVEVAVRDGSAGELLGVGRGKPVVLHVERPIKGDPEEPRLPPTEKGGPPG